MPTRSNQLVQVLGFPATLIHGDPMVLDRWLWLRRYLPWTREPQRVLDVGCGSGAFSLGAALRGYRPLGLSFSASDMEVAASRAEVLGAEALFEVFDVRQLGERADFVAAFDVVICCENIEHIADDLALFRAMANCLRPGGRLLLTTPSRDYHPLDAGDAGPFSATEDGGHVRKGYSRAMLEELCASPGLKVEAIATCSGFASQMLTRLLRASFWRGSRIAWAALLPLRVLPPLVDGILEWATGWPAYSICLVAYKPRWLPTKL